MEFIILVVAFLIALGCEKAPEEKKVYDARQSARKVAYARNEKQAIRAVGGRRIRKVSKSA